MTDKTYNVLFLCTGNSARSIMAEALVTTMGKGRFRGFSAGSQPGGTVNPFAIEQVKHTGYPTGNLRSKSWDEFAAPDASQMDFIITVCDKAGGELCPVWPGHPITAHWGFEDPAAAVGTDDEKRAVFTRVFREIMVMVCELVVSLRSRAKPIMSYWREAGTQNGRKSRASIRVGLRYRLDLAAACRNPCKHAASRQIEGRSGEISGLGAIGRNMLNRES